MAASIFLVRGDDPSLLNRAVRDLVDQLVDGADRSLVVEEIDDHRYQRDDGSTTIAPLVDAAQTAPFLTDHRVVIGRGLGRFGKAADVATLVDYLSAPLETTRLVLVWEKVADQPRLAPVPPPLMAAIGAAGGEVIDASAPKGRAVQAWIEESGAAAGISLTRDAVRAIVDHVGDDHARVPALLDTLRSTFGSEVRLDAETVRPYLGEAGDVAPWELTDTIATGDVAGALERLHRMQAGGNRHALQILATLTGHYAKMLRLDGAGIADERGAAEALGIKGSTFPAKKALQQSRALGHARLKRAIELLADADLAVRGATAVDNDTTMEVLVARLAMLHR